jgi:phosphatidate cytidylyltransferase
VPAVKGDLRTRVLSAAILAPLGLAALALGGPLWDAVIVLAAGAAATEWSGITRGPAQARPALRNVLVALVMLVTLCAASGHPLAAAALLLAGMAALLPSAAAMSAGAAYIAIPSVALVWLRAQPGGLPTLLLVMLTVWSSDTGAYIAGRLFGGPKLAPSISPSKTWSGAAGGLLAACLVGAVFALAAPAHRPPFTGGIAITVLLAGLLGIASQLGDLAESAVKRRFGVKDSGRLIPGHGGLLDRVDGLIAAAPAAALFTLLA